MLKKLSHGLVNIVIIVSKNQSEVLKIWLVKFETWACYVYCSMLLMRKIDMVNEHDECKLIMRWNLVTFVVQLFQKESIIGSQWPIGCGWSFNSDKTNYVWSFWVSTCDHKSMRQETYLCATQTIHFILIKYNRYKA